MFSLLVWQQVVFRRSAIFLLPHWTTWVPPEYTHLVGLQFPLVELEVNSRILPVGGRQAAGTFCVHEF
jgi:hypothetical protein